MLATSQGLCPDIKGGALGWFYLSGFALLIGAELNAEIDKALHPRQPQAPGQPKKIGPGADGP